MESTLARALASLSSFPSQLRMFLPSLYTLAMKYTPRSNRTANMISTNNGLPLAL